ncbi:MAG: type II secretion system protein [Candidatus Falkowbacteria bacterium]|nr:type II secretion system protein [Candidatus Falkowbacteria bacterium]
MELSSFTLIELIIVIAILTILAAVIVLVINPAEYLKSSRDSARMSDFASIKSSIGLYIADGRSSMGSSNIVYVSIPDSSAVCANLGLPALPATWSYACSTSDNYRKSNGTGWLPIDFTQISFGNVLQTLPVDPVNATSTGNYYTYVTGGSYQLSTLFESSKYNSTLTSQYYTVGTNSNLLPTLALVASSTNVTMNLSLANGYAFITSSSLNLSPYLNKYIIISDGTNNIQGFIKTQGTGETYTSLGTPLNFTSGWTMNGSGSILSANSWSTTGNGGPRRNVADYSNGSLIRSSFTGTNSGGSVDLRDANNGIVWAISGGVTSYTYAYYATGLSGWYFRNQGAGTTIITASTLDTILTPSATGVTITNTRGGSTYNWVSNSGIDPNTASFTVTVSL